MNVAPAEDCVPDTVRCPESAPVASRPIYVKFDSKQFMRAATACIKNKLNSVLSGKRR